MEQTKRTVIDELRGASHSPSYIAKILQYCKRSDEPGQDQRSAQKPRSGLLAY